MSIPEGGTILKQFDVTGMSCAACSARVEKAVSHVPGVTACAVSLLTNSMGVEGTAPDQAIIDAVQAAGYGASVQGGQDALRARRRRARRPRDAEAAAQALLVAGLSAHPDVFFHGAHDVGLAAAGLL